MIAVTRNSAESRFLFHSKDTVIFRAMELGLFDQGGIRQARLEWRTARSANGKILWTVRNSTKIMTTLCGQSREDSVCLLLWQGMESPSIRDRQKKCLNTPHQSWSKAPSPTVSSLES
ncbi:hypothetical protein BDP81DRAFT_414346 [Colletotrichum phormii]|uniref:Uncharacterized protein n=1 Tax=Colletotrichum phormii TaxID=359342 RepID=A0AAJ0A474_9PEZI|nr:uncharacterized protein BDP81DRAFT_414346 [Colletotrichum phormii]KAK1656181.1 hypothetical protein BDP81DRAFT_414346 [Colletotrichum phormii]